MPPHVDNDVELVQKRNAAPPSYEEAVDHRLSYFGEVSRQGETFFFMYKASQNMIKTN